MGLAYEQQRSYIQVRSASRSRDRWAVGGEGGEEWSWYFSEMTRVIWVWTVPSPCWTTPSTLLPEPGTGALCWRLSNKRKTTDRRVTGESESLLGVRRLNLLGKLVIFSMDIRLFTTSFRTLFSSRENLFSILKTNYYSVFPRLSVKYVANKLSWWRMARPSHI